MSDINLDDVLNGASEKTHSEPATASNTTSSNIVCLGDSSRITALEQRCKDLEFAIAELRLAIVQNEPKQRTPRRKRSTVGDIDLSDGLPFTPPTETTPAQSQPVLIELD